MGREMREILEALAVAVALIATSARPARADEPDEVVVRAPQAGGFVSRARVEDSPREITDAASLIEPMPGVHVRRLGADDSFATLSIRGTSSTQVAIYLGGVPLSGGADPSLDLATLPLWPGSSARVFRSFAPAALGRGSLGGTLVLDTPSARTPIGTEVYVAAGAYGSRRMRVGDVSGDPDGVRIATGFSASRSDDDFSYVDNAASAQAGREVLATRENAGHAAASGLAAIAIPVRLAPGTTGALAITTLAQVRRQRLPGTISVPTRLQRLDSNRLLGALELSLPAGSGAASVRTWARRDGLSIHGDPRESARLLSPSETADAIIAAGGSLGWKGRPSENTTFEARIDASGERFAPGLWIGSTQPPGARRTNAGLGIDATYRPVPRLTLAASARGDAWFDSADDGIATNDTRPTGNVGGELALGAVTLATHGGLLARPASFVERYGDHGIFLGNAGLRPESATTLDAGGSYATKLGGVLRVRLELAAFATWAEDLIVFIPRGANARARAENIGRARLLGTEAALDAAAYGIELRLSHTALATANEAECRVAQGTCERPALPGRPTHDVVGDLAYTLGPVRLRYGVDVVAGIQNDSIGSIVVPTRVLHAAGARLAVPGAPGLSLALDVRNLLDLRAARYPVLGGGTDPYAIGDLYDYPIPGRRLLLSARWAFPEPKASASVRAPQ